MDFNATVVGQILFIVSFVVIFFTVKFARGKTKNLPLTGFYSFLLNLLLPPVGWYFCYYWKKRVKC
jgi:hypothetical protein